MKKIRRKLLIVEHESRIAGFLETQLAEHFHEIDCATDCAGAHDAIHQRPYDVVILDVDLPDGSGVDMIKRWRREGYNHPVLILSARGGVEDRVAGLDSGADGYITKPFMLPELVARIRSLLRRYDSERKTVFEYRGVKLDVEGHVAHAENTPLELTAREFALLEVFLENPGRILSRNLICERIWDSSHDADANLLDVYMSRLRTKLQRSTGRSFFRTVRGVGYQME